MGAIDALKWDPAPRLFAYRYPNWQLNYKSQLIVSEAQEAVLVKEGIYYGPIVDICALTTDGDGKKFQ